MADNDVKRNTGRLSCNSYHAVVFVHKGVRFMLVIVLAFISSETATRGEKFCSASELAAKCSDSEKQTAKYSKTLLGVPDTASIRGALAFELQDLSLLLCLVMALLDRGECEGYAILDIRACLLAWANMLFSCARSFLSLLRRQVYPAAQWICHSLLLH
jgi:hypothetical protein